MASNTAIGLWKRYQRRMDRRQRTLCYLGELNDSAQARWLKTIEAFNEQCEIQQLRLFPSEVEPLANDPDVAQVLLSKVRLERSRQLGRCYLC